MTRYDDDDTRDESAILSKSGLVHITAKVGRRDTSDINGTERLYFISRAESIK